jgi:hypothetical protein
MSVDSDSAVTAFDAVTARWTLGSNSLLRRRATMRSWDGFANAVATTDSPLGSICSASRLACAGKSKNDCIDAPK